MKVIRVKRGFALAYAIIVLAVVVALILGVTQFRSMVSHTTELSIQEVNAQAAAEAGYIAALAELQAFAMFRTHEKATVTNEQELQQNPMATPKLQFTTALKYSSKLMAALPKYSGIEQIGANGIGEYTFAVGRGLGPAIGRGYDGMFRVKVAPCVLTGYPRPVIAVESRGKFDQRVVSLVTFLEAGSGQPQGNPQTTGSLDLNFPAFSSLLTDFVQADGDMVDIGMGSPNDSANQNVFSIGRMYGAQTVQIGNIEGNGTRQAFKRFGGIQTGGGVWFADPYDITFWDPSKPQETSTPVFHTAGGERPEFTKASSDLFDATQGRIADYRHSGKLALPDLAGSLERVIADPNTPNMINLASVGDAGFADDNERYDGGAFIRRVSNYQNPYGSIGESIEINFGRPAYVEGVTGDTDLIPYKDTDPTPQIPAGHPGKPSKPANLLYAKGLNVIVWGCPDRDIGIYTDKDIYVAGDFNQSPWHHQFYTSQDPGNSGALDADGRDARYLDPVRFAIDPSKDGGTLDDQEASREGSSAGAGRIDATANANLFQERKLARLTAKSRVWLDYRYPSRFMANELIPWIEYQLAWHLLTDPASAQTGAPAAATQAAAINAVRYQSGAEVSHRDKAIAVNVNGPLFGFRDASGNPTPVAQHFVKEVLKFDPGQDAFGKAASILTSELGTSPAPNKIHAAAEHLMWKVLAPFEKRAPGVGIWKMAQSYYDTVFVNTPTDQRLNQHKDPFNKNGNPNLLRFYVPEMTVNAVLVDGAVRHGSWDRTNPHADAKIYNEIGNAGATGVYLRFADGQASPGIGRVYGSMVNLRQSQPDPNLATTSASEGGGHYMPLKRKRIYARSQGRYLGLALPFGIGGDGGLPNVFRVISRREATLSAERGTADQMFTNWP